MSVWNLSSGQDGAVNFSGIDWTANARDLFQAGAADPSNPLLAADPREIRRAETAPMVLTIMAVDGSLCVGGIEEAAGPGEEYRYEEEYHRLYYSKTPRDPRMLPPLTRRRAPKEASVSHDSSVGASGNASGAVGDGIAAIRPEAAAKTPSPAPAPADHPRLAEYIEAARPEWDYPAIRGHVAAFSRDQDGSRLVQRLIEKLDHLPEIAREVFLDFEGLTTDVFGNYVVQKLFDVAARVGPGGPGAAEPSLLDQLTGRIRGKLRQYSFQTYSCRAMQRALENLPEADRDAIIHEMDGCVIESVLDQNASHVVQKIIEVCPAKCQFLIDAFLPELARLACHAYGCRVLQRTFEKCHAVEGVSVRGLLEAVLERISELTIHQYGNYVVQHGMLNAPEDLRHRIVMQLMPQMYALSCSKFASNVAEKVVVTATSEERDVLITHLTKSLSENQGGNYLVHMMQDTYGNYVVQRFLEVSSPAQRARIGEILMPYVETINHSVYGRHMMRRIESMGILPREFLRRHIADPDSPDHTGLAGANPPNGTPTPTNHNTKTNGGKQVGGGNGNGSHRGSRRAANKRGQPAPVNLGGGGGGGGLSNLGNGKNLISVPQLATTYSTHPFVTMQGYMSMRGYPSYPADPLCAPPPHSQKADFMPNAPPQASFGYPAAMYAANGCGPHPPFFVDGGYPTATPPPPSSGPAHAHFIGIPAGANPLVQPPAGPLPSPNNSSLTYYPKKMYVEGEGVVNCGPVNILNGGSLNGTLGGGRSLNGAEGYPQSLSQQPPNLAGARWCK